MERCLSNLAILSAVQAVAAGLLELRGEENGIQFGLGGALLKATCPGAGSSTVTFKRIIPNVIEQYLPGQRFNVSVHLQNCPISCANIPIDEPCADEPRFVPPLFFCNFVGSSGEAHVGPLAARIQESSTGKVTGHVFVNCPLPDYDVAEQILATQSGKQAEQPAMELRVSYVAPSSEANAKPIAFQGLPSGNLIRILALAPPPPMIR